MHIRPKFYQYQHASAMKTWDLPEKMLLEVQLLYKHKYFAAYAPV
jgi:hypothetical protein